MRFLPNMWSGGRPKARCTGCQPCLCDWAPVNPLDTKAWWASLVGSALCVLSHIIVGKTDSVHDSTGRIIRSSTFVNFLESAPCMSSFGQLYSIPYHCHKTLPWVWQLTVGTMTLLMSYWSQAGQFPLTSHPSNTHNMEGHCDIIVEGLWSQMPWPFVWSWTSYFSEFLLIKWEKHYSVPGRVVTRNQ